MRRYETPEITPAKHTQSGRWQVRIPAKLSGSGKRGTKYFPTKAEAMGFISNLEDVAAGLHLGETLMTRPEYDAIIEELARLAPFNVTLKDVIDYYIARHRASDARKISILEPLYRDTLQDAFSHYRSRVKQVLGAFASVFGDCPDCRTPVPSEEVQRHQPAEGFGGQDGHPPGDGRRFECGHS